MEVVEEGLAFPVREHTVGLIESCSPRLPVILEWGCGIGYASRDLTSDPRIKGKALVFGYGDVWDIDWNKIPGVKFLFFVKEHLPEYLKRAKLKIDFMFGFCGLDYPQGADFVSNIRGLAPQMNSGALIVFEHKTNGRPEFLELRDLFVPSPACLGIAPEGEPCFLRRI